MGSYTRSMRPGPFHNTEEPMEDEQTMKQDELRDEQLLAMKIQNL